MAKPKIKWSAYSQCWYATAYITGDWWDYRRVAELAPHVQQLNLRNGK